MREFVFLSAITAGLLTVSSLVFFLVPNSLSLFSFSGQTFLLGEVWRILTFPFVHIGLPHFLQNTFGMGIVGVLAYEFGLRGRHFLYSFFLSGLVIALIQVLVAPALVIAGLSLGVYAVLGTLVVKGSRFIPVYITAPLFSASIFLGQITCPGCNPVALFSSLFHFFGFAAGISIFLVIQRMPKKRMFSELGRKG